jgi:thioredoxin 1
MMSPVLAEIEQESSATLKIVKVDAAADAQFSASFGVSAVPTFVLFNNGQQAGQITGARSKKEMKKWLDDSIRATA